MKTSTAGLMALTAHEGIVLSRYKDSVGVWTIGIGHTKAAGNPDPATFTGSLMIGEAFGLLRHDIMKYEAAVSKAVKVPLAQHEFDALVSFHYNTGAIGKASFVKKLNAGDRAGAMKGMMDWRKPPEIIPRRTSERDLFKTGIYPSPFATVYPADKNGRVQWGQGKRIDLRNSLGSPLPVQPAPVVPPVPVEPIRAPVVVPKVPEPVVATKQGWLAALLVALFGKG